VGEDFPERGQLLYTKNRNNLILAICIFHILSNKEYAVLLSKYGHNIHLLHIQLYPSGIDDGGTTDGTARSECPFYRITLEVVFL
jgi:hypothetical protein